MPNLSHNETGLLRAQQTTHLGWFSLNMIDGFEVALVKNDGDKI
jgi:hypothetical protein